MNKKLTALLAVSSVTIAALTGCGSGQSAKTESTKTESPKTESTAASLDQSGEAGITDAEKKVEGDLELALFQGGYGADYWEEIISRFEEKYPDVHVNYKINPKIGDLIRPQIISGDVPDLIYHNMGQSDGVVLGLIKDKELLELTDLFEENALDKEEKLKDIMLAGKLESKAYAPYGDGKIYLAPLNTSPTGLIYNKALFEEKGWEVPETWDEFFALGDVAKEDGRALITFPGIYPTYCENFLNTSIADAAGMDALNDIFDYKEGSFSNDKVMQVLKNIEKIKTGGYLMDGSTGLNHTQSQSEMMLGKALFIPNGTWIENEMKDAPRENEENFEFALLPGLKLNADDPDFVSTSIEQLSIPKNAKNPEAAKEFIRFIYTDDSVRLFGEKAQGMIAVKGATDLVKEYFTPGMNNMFSVLSDESVTTYSPAYQTSPANAKFNKNMIYENGLLPVLNGEMDAEAWAAFTEKGFASLREDLASENK